MNRFFYAALTGMLLSLAAPQGVQGRALLVIGSTDNLWPTGPNLTMETRGWIEMGGRRLESTHPQDRGFILVDTSATHVAPFFVEPGFNISPGYLARGGWERTRVAERDKQFFRALDGDPDTFYFFAGIGYTLHPTVDLGGIFPVNRIVFYTHADRPEQYTDYFTLYVNDGDPAKIDTRGNPIWERAIRQETENKDSVVETLFPTRPVRYVSIEPQAYYVQGARTRLKPWEIAEFEIYGEGYVPEATYLSEIIDISEVVGSLPGEQASWGQLHWIGHKDPGARVVIQTRTGTDEDPNMYWWSTGQGSELTHLKPDGTPMTLADYQKVIASLKGPITYDTENWSFWSPPYDFDQGVAGMPILSPGPRRYIQFRIQFLSTLTAGSRMEAIGFDFSKPPIAQGVVAEIFPREVETAVDTTFTYVLRPLLGEADWGFDSLEIETFVQPSAVRSVRILSDAVAEVDLSEYPPEILADRLIVHFPRFAGAKGASDTGKLLEVVFEAMVVKYGTEFRGHVFDQHSDEVRQLVEEGDATHAYRGGGVSVTTSFGKQLLSSVQAVPPLFTPNGDGINEQTRISYAILNLTEGAEARVVIYDLSGRALRQLQRGPLFSGWYEWSWNGRTDEGNLVPPGTYIYRVSVESDKGDEDQSGILSVAY